jgi:hypothetical protein
MVFLWFLYNMPEKLKMQEEEIDILITIDEEYLF